MRSPRHHSRIARGWVFVSSLAFLSTLASVATAQQPTSPAHRVSSTDLVLYVEFDGFDAHAKEWKASAAYKALNETTLGALVEDLAAQGLDMAMKGKLPDPPPGAQVVKTLELIAKKGFAVGVNGKTPAASSFTLVVRGGISPEITGLLQRLGQAPGKSAMRGSRKVTVHGDTPTSEVFIDDKGDLVATTVANTENALAVLDGKAPNVATNASYVELAKPDGTFKPIALAFVDPKVVGPLPPPMVALGLDGLKRVDYRWGTNDTALYSVFRLVAPSPRKGILSLFDGPSFDKTTLPPFPAGVDGFTAISLSPATVYDQLFTMIRQAIPNGDQQVDAIEQFVNQGVGVKLREELLAGLGPKWSVYGIAAKGPNDPPINFVAFTSLTESAKFAAALDKALQAANEQIKLSGGPNAGKAPPQFQKLAGSQLGFELVFPPGTVLPPPMATLKPTILIGKKSLVIASGSAPATMALVQAEGGGVRWKPDAAYSKILDTLPKGMVFLNVSDPRQSLPQMIGQLPMMLAAANTAMANQAGPAGAQGIPIKIDPAKIPQSADLSSKLFPAYMAMSVDAKGVNVITRESLPGVGNQATTAVVVALLLPAVQASREAARRAQCVNNFKQIGLAFHNFHSTNNTFPGNIAGKDGKPLLSWRVAILPYLERRELYDKFKLDEPWDSPNNKPLLKEMPTVYVCPSRPNTEPGMTYSLGWSGPGTVFNNPLEPTGLQMITDGTSNTILVTEAKTAVPWTKPEDLPFDPKANDPLFGAGSPHPGGFNVLFCDGSVRFIKVTINPAVLKALITINGGEVVSRDAF